ncbi:MAG: hypothetical protein IID32_01625 [Planctomycetes bacterium]|nr:hypothetical protein [Planctomycetota bacterium]
MMSKRLRYSFWIWVAVAEFILSGPLRGEDATGDVGAFRQSLVYIEASEHSYEAYRPWRQSALVQNKFYGCAVGPYEVLTTAYGVTDAAFINVRRTGQNESITATLKFVDYESNLCLLALDRESMSDPLEPVRFSEDYEEGVEVEFYWLSQSGQVHSGRGYTDHARVTQSVLSFGRFLNYIISNTSVSTSTGQLYCRGEKAIGLACWSKENNNSGLIPGVVINRFLADASDGQYEGFAHVGFATSELLDPVLRQYLKLPTDLKEGVYVKDVYTIGTGSQELKPQDVILAIDGAVLDSHGWFAHPRYMQIHYDHLITNKAVGESIQFKIWRSGKEIDLEVTARNFSASDMAVPYHEYGKQPEYLITGGFLFQKLTRAYMQSWGDDWRARVSPQLYRYYQELAFKPSDERRDIVILSYVLPAQINQGYQQLRQRVVKRFNGQEVRSLKDITAAQKANPESLFDVIEFENDNPVVVIERSKLLTADAMIAQTYGIGELVHID